MAKKQIEKPTFEASVARLEEIVQKTDSGVTTLEEMLTLVEEGTRLTKHCRAILEAAELRLEKIDANLDEPVTAEPIEQQQGKPIDELSLT